MVLQLRWLLIGTGYVAIDLDGGVPTFVRAVCRIFIVKSPFFVRTVHMVSEYKTTEGEKTSRWLSDQLVMVSRA